MAERNKNQPYPPIAVRSQKKKLEPFLLIAKNNFSPSGQEVVERVFNFL